MTKLGSLQALRGIAASLVILSHALQSMEASGPVTTGTHLFYWYLGSAGVRVFFVLSGFIMMKTTYDDEPGLNTAAGFLKKRIIRIVPIYYIATLLTFGLAHFMRRSMSGVDVAASLLFIPNVFAGEGVVPPVVGQGWTLNYEMFFYAVFAFSLLFPKRISLPGLFLTFLALTALPVLGLPPTADTPGQALIGFYADPIILLFLFGVVIAIAERQFGKVQIFARPLPTVAVLMLVDAVAFYVLMSRFDIQIPAVWSYSISLLCVVVCVFGKEPDPTRLEKLSETLGDASYSTYLYHTFLLAALNRIFVPTGMLLESIYIACALIGGNCLGYILHSRLERPLSARLRQGFASGSNSPPRVATDQRVRWSRKGPSFQGREPVAPYSKTSEK